MDDSTPSAVELLRPGDGAAIVELQSEVDIHSATQFKGALLQGIGDGARRIIIDFTEVSFIDSTSLGVVATGVKGIKAHGGTLEIVCPNESLRSIFVTTGLNQILGMYHTRAEALAAAQR
jgi:anti-sigma B factor antagonist